MLQCRGYMAPEYINRGLITTKSDIFSLGVIIIEIVTGHRNYPDENCPDQTPQEFIDLAWKLINFNFQDGITFFRDFVWFEEDWKRLNSQQFKISLNPLSNKPLKKWSYSFPSVVILTFVILQVLKKWRNRLQKTTSDEELYYYQQIRRCIQIGLVCVDLDRSKRPTTSQIIKMLHVESVDLSRRKRVRSLTNKGLIIVGINHCASE